MKSDRNLPEPDRGPKRVLVVASAFVALAGLTICAIATLTMLARGNASFVFFAIGAAACSLYMRWVTLRIARNLEAALDDVEREGETK